ncbi:MAG: serine--tRNA ligase, partial [Pseudomonadota bacterium]
MHDIRFIRENPAAFDAALSRRGLAPMSAELLALDEGRRMEIRAAESAAAEQNAASKAAGIAKAKGDKTEFNRLRDLVALRKNDAILLTDNANKLDALLRKRLMEIANLPLDEVPDGPDESGNVEIRRLGSPRVMDFKPLEHFDIPAAKGGLDFQTAAKLSGSRFVVLRGAVARVHRALAQFMLDLHTSEHGLAETWTPVLVKEDAMYGTNQLPKF